MIVIADASPFIALSRIDCFHLLRAKRQGLIPEVKRYIMALHKAKFRMSPAVAKYVLTKAGEL